jgi:phosphopantothenoylcysteine decarboxylase/phosphopantothenate--cysteine ligase
MRILITAGPTREHWDDVRFLSSGATGRLGIEIARAAADAGHESVLVLGPTHLEAPALPVVRVEPVVSARDMLAACLEHWPTCHALVATAAVADFRPAERHRGKRAKSGDGATLRLERNPDVLATLAADKGDRRVLGFALQVDDGEHLARAKLVAKHLDGIVLDGPAALGVGVADFRLLLPDGSAREFPATSKADLARHVVAFLADGV